jgi:hypothetical protein
MTTLMKDINPNQDDVSEYVEMPGRRIAHRYGILTTSFIAYAVYEPSSLFGAHSTIAHHDTYGWLGDMTTKQLSPELESLQPYSKERSDAVGEYLDALKEEAEAIIKSAFPGDFPQEGALQQAVPAYVEREQV